jgi:hypothetical protein
LSPYVMCFQTITLLLCSWVSGALERSLMLTITEWM